MVLITHIFLALASVAYTTYVFFTPSRAKLRFSYALVASTLATGTYLVVSTHAPMLQSCMTGLLYTGAVSIGLVSAHKKLASQETISKDR